MKGTQRGGKNKETINLGETKIGAKIWDREISIEEQDETPSFLFG